MFSTLLALAVGIQPNSTLQRLGRVKVYVMHQGPPVKVVLVTRQKDNLSDKWVYNEELKYLPKRLWTSPKKARSVIVPLPTTSSRYSQLCVRYTPDKPSGPSQLLLSVESCSNLPGQTSEPSQTPTTLKAVV